MGTKQVERAHRLLWESFQRRIEVREMLKAKARKLDRQNEKFDEEACGNL